MAKMIPPKFPDAPVMPETIPGRPRQHLSPSTQYLDYRDIERKKLTISVRMHMRHQAEIRPIARF